jgi:hypothetical protein
MCNQISRSIILFLLFTSVLLCAGCSYKTDFVVLNKSDGVIDIQYRLKHFFLKPSGEFDDSQTPAALPITEFEKSKHEWRKLAANEYTWDGANDTFTVHIAPNQALRVGSAVNYTGSADNFDLMSIKISGKNGSLDLQGKPAQTEFKSQSSTQYVLEYR